MENIIKRYFDLRPGQGTAKEITDDVRAGCEFKGINLWALVCAILIASVGLNMSSTAVVIGAMLISPLMGPIIGAGYALSTFDFELLKTAGRNFLTFVVISLTTSAIYFALSPLSDPTPELEARTFPTIYDVMIAFFGGVAGIVAYTRKEKGGTNILPGVAIATALMPPLCTAGYGITRLAHPHQWYMLAGALYLFVINSVMIASATMLVTKFVLRTRRRQYEDAAMRLRVTRIIIPVIIATILPSLWLAYTLVLKNDFDSTIEKFQKNEIEDRHILIWKTEPSFREDTIAFVTLGVLDSTIQSEILNSKKNTGYEALKNTRITFPPVQDYISEKKQASRTEEENQLLRWRDSVVTLNLRLNQYLRQTQRNKQILRELSALDTNITAFGVAPMHQQGGTTDTLVNVLLRCKQLPPPEGQEQIRRFLVEKFDSLAVQVNYEGREIKNEDKNDQHGGNQRQK